MVSKANWKAFAAIVLVAALFVTSGSWVMASNMGFKINKQLSTFFSTGNLNNVTWVSIPYNNPYTTFGGVCRAVAQGSNVPFSAAMISLVNVEETLVAVGAQAALNGQARNQNCLTCCPTVACAGVGGNCGRNIVQNQDNAGALQPGMSGSNGGLAGVKIRVTGNTAASPSSVVLVGSSLETQNTPRLIPNAVDVGPVCAGNTSNNWISVPYHTTLTTAAEVCTALGTTTLATAVRITRISPTGVAGNFNCGTTLPSASNFNLVIGEGIRVCDTAAPTTNLPSAAPGGILIPHF
jgi:hypothetical protein